MIHVTKEVIKECAKNMMFNLTDAEVEKIYSEFQTILSQVDYLSKLPGVDKAEPMTFPYQEHQRLLRDDKPSRPLKPEDALKNSNSKLGTQIKLPKVVGNDNDETDE